MEDSLRRMPREQTEGDDSPPDVERQLEAGNENALIYLPRSVTEGMFPCGPNVQGCVAIEGGGGDMPLYELRLLCFVGS